MTSPACLVNAISDATPGSFISPALLSPAVGATQPDAAPTIPQKSTRNHDLEKRKAAMRIMFAAAFLALALAASTSAAPRVAQQTCLDATAHVSLDTQAIVAGLGLTEPEQMAVRARLSTYNSVRGFAALDGLGLTAAQQTTIMQRIAAQVNGGHPLGWPCAPFKNQPRVVSFVRSKLAANGFTSTVITSRTARQFQLKTVQDGSQYYGVVAKTGRRSITLRLDSTHAGSDTVTYKLGFDA